MDARFKLHFLIMCDGTELRVQLRVNNTLRVYLFRGNTKIMQCLRFTSHGLQYAFGTSTYLERLSCCEEVGRDQGSHLQKIFLSIGFILFIIFRWLADCLRPRYVLSLGCQICLVLLKLRYPILFNLKFLLFIEIETCDPL